MGFVVPHIECMGVFVPRERGRARASGRVVFFLSTPEYVPLYPYVDVSVDVRYSDFKKSQTLSVLFFL